MTALQHELVTDAPPRSAIAELLLLAGPTVVQMGSYTLMQFIDTWMLARVNQGIAEPTAAANAGMLAFAVISLGLGVLWVVNTLVSQSYGRGRFRECGPYLWQGIWFSLAFSILLLPALPRVAAIFGWMGHEPMLVQLEAKYLQIVIGASFIKLAGTACGQFLLAINRPVSVLLATVIGVAVNAFAAWIMVFGHLGVRPMGVAGAAWGQNIGVTVETVLLIALCCVPSIRSKFNVFAWRFRWEQMKTLLKVGIPSGVQVIADVLAWSMFGMWVIGVFGTKAMAANTFMFRYMVVSFMPAFGISTAVTALVGRYIGMGRPDLARHRANLGFALVAAYMLTCGLFFFVGRHRLIGLFSDDPEIVSTGAMLLVFAAVYQFFDAMYINYNGALRGAGDTFVPAMATGILCWGITVFGGYAVAKTFTSFGVKGPWFVATFYGIVLGLFMLRRFRRGDWEHIHLEQGPDADRLRGFEVVPHSVQPAADVPVGSPASN